MALAIYGTGVSRGIAIGTAHVASARQLDSQEKRIAPERIEDEVRRFRQAVVEARDDLVLIRERLRKTAASAEFSDFLDVHVLMLEDGSVTEGPADLIRELKCNAEWALHVQCNRIKQIFKEMDDPYIRSRAEDVDQVVTRVLHKLQTDGSDAYDAGGSFKGQVLVAHEVDPAHFLLLMQQGIAGLVTEHGGPLSHTAILARNLKLPAAMGMHGACRLIREGETIVVDGSRGAVIADPSKSLRRHYRDTVNAERKRSAKLRSLRRTPACTTDGVEICLQANLDLATDLALVQKNRADGIGLYRTEYLFLNQETPPDEEHQYDVYRQLVSDMKRPVTIRTIDLGADKQVDARGSSEMSTINPALGLRAIRLCLHSQELFIPQLRAILRASAHGPLKILVPMLSNTREVAQVRGLVHTVEKDLKSQGIAVGEYQIGGMIEVPAAALSARAFASELDFLSIGTNDLIQYTLAIDRIDEQVGYLYDPLHPAVLKLLQLIIEGAGAEHKPVSMCGEMAGDASYTRLLLGLGLRDFSMHPGNLLEIKEIINASDAGKLGKLTRKILRCSNPDQIEAMVHALNHPPH